MAQTATAIHKEKHSINRAFASHFAKSMFLTVSGLVILSFIATRIFTHVDLNLYGYMVGTLVFIGGFFYRFIASGERPPPKKKTADGSNIAIGDSADFAFPGEHASALLIRLGENKYVAYRNAYTYLRCPVFWVKDKNEMNLPMLPREIRCINRRANSRTAKTAASGN